DDEAVVVRLVLLLGRLVAVEAVDPFAGVDAQLVLVDDGVLLLGVALGALPRRADERSVGLLGLHPGPGPVNQEPGDDQPKPDDQGNEDGTERHGSESPFRVANRPHRMNLLSLSPMLSATILRSSYCVRTSCR